MPTAAPNPGEILQANNTTPRARRYALSLLAPVIGAMLLSLPLMAINSAIKASKGENRSLAPLPALPRSLTQMAQYPEKFDAFLRDHFGFRPQLLVVNKIFLSKILGLPLSNVIILGTDNWYFYGGENEALLFRNAMPLSGPILERWSQALQQRQSYLQQHDIPYLLALAPDKHSIYAEKMPSYMIRLPQPSQSDQLRQLAQEQHLPFLDLREALLAAKQSGQLYYRTDTHWNQWGAYLGYRAIMTQWRADGLPAPIQLTLAEGISTPFRGDLARLNAEEKGENAPVFPLPCEVKGLAQAPKSGEAMVTHCPTGKKKLLMFRDSFAIGFTPFFSSTFAEVTYVWQRPTFSEFTAWVEKVHPDFVLEERVERGLQEGI